MYRKTNLINIKKTLFDSPSNSSRHGGVDRFGSGSSSSSSSSGRRPGNRRRISALELELRLRFNRLMREKKSKLSEEEASSSKIKIQDDWIGWMIIWKNPAVLDGKQGKSVDPSTTDSAAAAALLLNQAFKRRRDLVRRKELSPQDAALIIQTRFRDHMKRKSSAIQGLKELALANAKLKEMRNWFYKKKSSYRKNGKFSQDPQDHQGFQKKIIVLLLTVDAVEGATARLRFAKKIMIQELEMMLDKADTFRYTKLKINAVLNASEMGGHGVRLLRLAFGRRLPEENQKWMEEMSVPEAATLIARRFREYLVRKANAEKAHEEMALVEAKWRMDIKGLCKKDYDDEEERVRVTEKVIVLLLTLDAIQGANLQDRARKRDMMDEVEAMLEIVDPKPNPTQH